MNAPARELDEVERPRAAAMKFAYASGSRPLEGYTIKRGVGRGGFGEVYFATSDAGKEVALKLIRRNLEVELRGVTQCLNLKHANLIGLFDIRSDENGDQWVIMEYVSGESLEDVIDRNPNGMPIEETLHWMRGICAGVAYLHDHGIVHRDLKPGNIFCDEDVVKIGDYGLAKFISCSRRSGQTESVGTVHYMAPEIANGRYGREIDTYALGIILFEMLTGTVPFEGESVGEVLMKHLTAEPDLSRLAEPYRSIVQRALAKDPAARIKDVGELVSLLPGGVGAMNAATYKPAVQAVNEAVSSGPSARFADRQREPRAQDKGQKGIHAKFNFRTDRHADATTAADDIEEPIWKAVRETFFSFRQRFDDNHPQKLSPLRKALTIFAVVALCLWFSDQAFRLMIPLAICYGVYYFVWASFVRPSMKQHASQLREGDINGREPTNPLEGATVAWDPTVDPSTALEPVTSPAARYAQQVRKRRLRPSWRDRAQTELATKPFRTKFSELLGSMLMSFMVAALASIVAPVLMNDGVTSQGIATHLWLTIVGTLGSWAILVPSKFAEGKVEDQVPLRVSLLLLGGAVGVAAWALSNALLVTVPSSTDPLQLNESVISHEMLGWAIPTDGNPPLAAFVTYFAFLFLLVRWWRQAEYTRERRLSLWRVATCVFVAWLLQLFWWFPQPAGMMVAGVIAFATQLSSPWLPPSRRRAWSGEPEKMA